MKVVGVFIAPQPGITYLDIVAYTLTSSVM